VALTGLQQGSNLRLDTSVGDTTSSGSIATYTVAADTNSLTFNSVTVTIHGFSVPANRGQILFVRHIGAGSCSLVQESSTATLTTERIGLGDGIPSNSVGLILGSPGGTFNRSALFIYTGSRWQRMDDAVNASSIFNSQLATMVAGRLKGVPIGGGTTNPSDLTAAQVNTIVGSADLSLANALFLSTSQVVTGSLPLNISLSAATTLLLINIAGDGDITDMTTAAAGRIVVMQSIASGTKRIIHQSGGAGATKFFCPLNTDYYLGPRDNVLFFGIGAQGWFVMPMGGSSATAEGTIRGRALGAGTGPLTDLTRAQLYAIFSAAGLQGPPGEDGEDGEDGEQGPPGNPGLEVVQRFTTSGTTNDLVLDPTTTTLTVDTGNSDWLITGFAGGYAGRRLIVMNASNSGSRGGFGNSGSAAENSILLTGTGSTRTGRRYSALLEYDGLDSIWRIIADTPTTPFDNISNIAGDYIEHDGTDWVSRTAASGPGTYGLGVVVGLGATNPTATNATTNLSAGAYTIVANTARVGTTYKAVIHFAFVHAAGATPTITAEWVLTGGTPTGLASFVITPTSTGGTYRGTIEGLLRFQTIGGSAGGISTVRTCNSFGNTGNDSTGGVDGGFTGSDTTVTQTIEFRIRMTTAVASNTLTVQQAYIERVLF
jgi:hypothetical protein